MSGGRIVDYCEFDSNAIGTIHPVTREQVIMLIDLPDDLRAAAAEVLPDGRLAVTWHPEGLVNRYHPGWLWRHRPESPAGPGLPRRRPWQPGQARDTALVRLEGSAVRAGDETALGAWLTAMHVDGLSIVEHLPPDPDMVPEIPHTVALHARDRLAQRPARQAPLARRCGAFRRAEEPVSRADYVLSFKRNLSLS